MLYVDESLPTILDIEIFVGWRERVHFDLFGPHLPNDKDSNPFQPTLLNNFNYTYTILMISGPLSYLATSSIFKSERRECVRA